MIGPVLNPCHLPRVALRASLKAHRAEVRRAEAARLVKSTDAPEPSSVFASAARSGRDRKAFNALQAAKQRDESARDSDERLDESAIYGRVVRAVGFAIPNATQDERDDITQWLCVKVIERHGLTPLASEMRGTFLERRAVGKLQDSRERAERREARMTDDVDGEDAQTAEEKIDALAHRAGRSALAAGTRPPDACDHLQAEVLAERLGAVCGDPLTTAEHAVILCGIAGYAGGVEYSAAVGIAPGTGRKRVHDGSARLAVRFPTADDMRDACAAAARLGEGLDATVRTAEQRVTDAHKARLERAASAAVAVADRSLVSARPTATAPRGVRVGKTGGRSGGYGSIGVAPCTRAAREALAVRCDDASAQWEACAATRSSPVWVRAARSTALDYRGVAERLRSGAMPLHVAPEIRLPNGW